MEGDHKHKIMDRPFMPKYGTVFQVLLQVVVAYHRTELGLMKSQGAIPLPKKPYISSVLSNVESKKIAISQNQ